MIGNFPVPYPDELFYSICARFADRVRYQTQAGVPLDLFGAPQPNQSMEFPSRLEHLVANLPPGHPTTVKVLVLHHTMFPYYAPFLPADRVDRIWDSMKGELSRGWTSYARVSGAVNRSKWLRFCKECVAQDRKTYGETYWHRTHQLPGYEICGIHGTALLSSQVPVRRRRRLALFEPAELVVDDTGTTEFHIPTEWHEFLRRLSSDINWLLVNPDTSYEDPDLIRKRHRGFVSDAGLMNRNGTLQLQRLNRCVQAYYPEGLLDFLACNFNPNSKHSWAVNLVRVRSDHEQHPLHHLLMIQFLGLTVQEFFSAPVVNDNHEVVSQGLDSQSMPFGCGPWPCLNPICRSFQQLSIAHVSIDRSFDGERPRGRFVCECGFKYARLDPDQCPEDSFRMARIEDYGHLWKEALTAYWNDPDLNLKQVAKLLGVLPASVKLEAFKSGLQFPRNCNRGKRRTVTVNHRLNAAEERKQEKKREYRRKWKAALQAYPGATRTFLDRKLCGTYSWLRRNDPDWLQHHLPSPTNRRRKSKGRKSNSFWAEQDQAIAAQVREVALQIRNMDGRPQWVNRAAILEGIEQDLSLELIGRNMPLTLRALQENVEGRIEFALRKIEWFVRDCQFTGRRPTMSNMIHDLYLQNVKDDPVVARALQEALNSVD